MVDGPNTYIYLNNDPINLIDPWGLCGEKSLWNKSLSDIWEDFWQELQQELTNPQFLNQQQMMDLVINFSGGMKVIGGSASGTKIVIGETADRVKAVAQQIGAKYYNPRYKLPSNPTVTQLIRAMRNNYQWLRQKVKDGYEIIDLGIDKNREIRGIFYEAEKRWLKIWGK